MNSYPQCLSIIPQLRHISNQSSVEVELQNLQTEAPAYPERHRQLAAIRYYLQEILWTTGALWLKETQNVSNYSALVDRIKQWKKPGEGVCFVTFNYDTLLDEALRHGGYPFTELSAYTAGELMLVKLHGSVNWARVVTTPCDDYLDLKRHKLANVLIDMYSSLEISKEYLMVGEAPPSPRNKKAVFPALAIPVESKLDFECPQHHVEALKSFLPEVRKILVIGWRATEQPFLELLKNGLGSANPHIKVINGLRTHSENAISNIQRAGIPARYTIQEQTEYGFTEFIRNHGETEFLRS